MHASPVYISTCACNVHMPIFPQCNGGCRCMSVECQLFAAGLHTVWSRMPSEHPAQRCLLLWRLWNPTSCLATIFSSSPYLTLCTQSPWLVVKAAFIVIILNFEPSLYLFFLHLLQDVVRTICTPYGFVQRIVIFRKNGLQVLVEYP